MARVMKNHLFRCAAQLFKKKSYFSMVRQNILCTESFAHYCKETQTYFQFGTFKFIIDDYQNYTYFISILFCFNQFFFNNLRKQFFQSTLWPLKNTHEIHIKIFSILLNIKPKYLTRKFVFLSDEFLNYENLLKIHLTDETTE